MEFHAQGLRIYILQRAYEQEEPVLKQTVKYLPISSAPTKPNIISSYGIYKVKLRDDNTLQVKVRDAPNGNKDIKRCKLKTYFATCPPTGIRIFLSISRIFKWILVKAYFKSVFLQTEGLA